MNVASRIEKLADVGGICISGQVYKTIRNKPDIEAVCLGEKRLRNVEHPVRIYALTGEGLPEYRGESFQDDTAKKPGKKYVSILTGIVIIVLLIVGFVWIFTRGDETIDSLAILPFTYPENQTEIQYLSESIPDRILFKLQKLPNLKRVIPFSSVLQYYRKGVPDVLDAGRKLGVKAVGIGRMSLVNGNLEINIEIIDVKNNNLILKEPYTETLAHLTHIPITIAQDITSKLGHRLTEDEQTLLMKRESENSEAYQHYLMGRFHWNKRSPEGIQKAIEYYHRAIAQDSSYALAYAGLADAYILLPQYSGIFLDDVWDKVTCSVQKAMALDPYLSEVRMAHANLLLNEWKWEEARREIELAIDLDSNNSYAHFMYGMLLIVIGDMEGAVSKFETALNLDPLSMVANRSLGIAYTILNKHDAAIEQFEKTIAIAPDDPTAYLSLAGIYLEMGDAEKSLFNIQKYYNLINFIQLDEIAETTFPDGNFHMSLLPQVFSRIQHEIQRTRHPILSKPGYQFMNYALSGEADGFFTMLNKALDFREFISLTLLHHPITDPFRSDPRFREVLIRANLDQYYE